MLFAPSEAIIELQVHLFKHHFQMKKTSYFKEPAKKIRLYSMNSKVKEKSSK